MTTRPQLRMSKRSRRRHQIVHPKSASAKIATGILVAPGTHKNVAPWRQNARTVHHPTKYISTKTNDNRTIIISETLKDEIERVSKISLDIRRAGFYKLSFGMKKFDESDYLNAKLWFQTFVDGNNLYDREISYNRDYDDINEVFASDLLFLFYEKMSDNKDSLKIMMKQLNKIPPTAPKSKGRTGGLILELEKMYQ